MIEQWRKRHAEAKRVRRIYAIDWIWRLAVADGDAPSGKWLDWYAASLAAGTPLPPPQ